MKKGLVIGSILVVLMIALLPTTSIAESSKTIERIEKQKILLKELQDNLYPKEWEPTCILRLLLWLRNSIILSILLIIYIIMSRMSNQSTIDASGLISEPIN